MATLLPLADALALLRAQPERLPVETVLGTDAAGRVCAADVHSPSAVPPHTAAGCDGYAVRARDLARAAADAPVLLPVGGSARCGDAPVCGLPHTAWEVASGGALPSPFDTVLAAGEAPVETAADDGTPRWIRVTRPPQAGTNIRQRGEDIAEGARVLAAGTTVRPAHLMALASAGVERIAVRAQPRVAVLSTGRELVDDWRDELLPGQVRNGNGPYLVAMLQQHGALPRYLRTIADEPAEFRRALEWASQHRYPLVVSSGATAAGRQDFAGGVLAALGAQWLFRGVALRPGWPVLCARLPHGGFFLGLPGNPASCAACFRLFALPLLRTLAGMPPEPDTSVLLGSDTARDPLCTRVLRARLASDAGRLVATPLAEQDAHRITPLVEANAWLLLPPGPGTAPAGTVAAALPMRDHRDCST